jgi:hypothetical protein
MTARWHKFTLGTLQVSWFYRMSWNWQRGGDHLWLGPVYICAYRRLPDGRNREVRFRRRRTA